MGHAPDGGAAAEELARLGRLLAGAAPAIVARLVAAGAPGVHREAMALLERPLLEHALALTGGNRLRAARLLGMNRNTLRKRCRILGLAPPGPAAPREGAGRQAGRGRPPRPV